MEKPLRVQQIILPPYSERGRQRILREKKKNVLSVPLSDLEFFYWYRVGCHQRGMYSRPYTYVVIALESSLILAAFLIPTLILRAVAISPDAPISMFMTYRNYFSKIRNSVPAEKLARSLDEHFYLQYRYLTYGSIPISICLIILCSAAIMLLTGPESSWKRCTISLLHLLMFATSTAFVVPSLLRTRFRVEVFTTTDVVMNSDFLDAWMVAASYEQSKWPLPKKSQLISLFEQKFSCCGVNRSVAFRKEFSKHFIVPLIYSENFTRADVQEYVDLRWQICTNRTEALKTNRKTKPKIKEIIRCSKLMPNMEENLQFIHICYIFVAVVNALLFVLLTFSNCCKWILECVNEKHHIEDIKEGEAMRMRFRLIYKGTKEDGGGAEQKAHGTDSERNRLALQTQNMQYVPTTRGSKEPFKRFIFY